ncbi:MAG TPA: MFS transporter [Terriglobia bacterium]|nr:MFS transporter [Terriglobia bacterium]
MTLRAFRHRNYRLYFFGQIISLTGTWMQSVAQSWLVYRLTGSASMLGIVGFASQFPVFLLAPVGGSFADSHPRRRSLIVVQVSAMILAVLLAALTFTNRIESWHIVLFASLLGVVSAFDIPIRQSFVVEMVGRDDLMNAIALNSSMMNGARIIGPAVAGVLVAAVGEAWCFLLNAISFLAVIVCLMMITVGNRPPAEHPGARLDAIIEGFRFVLRTRPIRALLILLGVVSLVGWPYQVLMPIFAAQILNGGPRGLGLLMGSSGIGALIGALLLAGRQGVRGLGDWVMLSCAGLGVSLVFFAFSRNFWVSMLLLLPVGFCGMVQMASSNTLIQAMVLDQFRGRVMAVYSMMFMGMSPIGALIAGLLANSLGAPLAIAAGAVICVVGALIFRSRLPHIRTEGRQLILAQTVAAGQPADSENAG